MDKNWQVVYFRFEKHSFFSSNDVQNMTDATILSSDVYHNDYKTSIMIYWLLLCTKYIPATTVDKS